MYSSLRLSRSMRTGRSLLPYGRTFPYKIPVRSIQLHSSERHHLDKSIRESISFDKMTEFIYNAVKQFPTVEFTTGTFVITSYFVYHYPNQIIPKINDRVSLGLRILCVSGALNFGFTACYAVGIMWPIVLPSSIGYIGYKLYTFDTKDYSFESEDHQ